MDALFYIGLIFPVLYSVLSLIYAITILTGKKGEKPRRDAKISILVAARNEEENILRCLESLAEINYPQELYEVLVGDDDSEDNTGTLILEFIENHPNFRYFRITESFKGTHGKPNVLAHLAHKATGDYFLITDADITVHPEWPATLLGNFNGDAGMVSGPTLVEGKSLFARMQSLDWLMGIVLARAHSVLGIPVTGVGNNMIVSRESYFSVGGYEKVPFSVTEDFKLFQVMCEKGPWEFRQIFEPEAVNVSEPVKTLGDWGRQRKRWFKGGLELAWYNIAALFVNALSVPSLALLLLSGHIRAGLFVYAAKVLMDFVILAIGTAKLNRFHWMIWFPLYEIYYHFIAVILPIQQLIPGKVVWKGRKY